jgi:hypothetical protein
MKCNNNNSGGIWCGTLWCVVSAWEWDTSRSNEGSSIMSFIPILSPSMTFGSVEELVV